MWILVLAAAAVVGGEGEDCSPPPVTATRPPPPLSPSVLPPGILASATRSHHRYLGNLPKGVLEADPEPVAAAFLQLGGGLSLAYRSNTTSTALGSRLYRSTLADPEYNHTWTPPFWDCLLQIWVFGYISNLPENRGLLGLYYPLDRAELDGCDQDVGALFPYTPRCDPISTKCVSTREEGYSTRLYRCICLPGFLPPHNFNLSAGGQGEDQDLYRCIPNCGYETNCSEQPHLFLKSFVISVQTIAMGVTILTGILIFNRRKCSGTQNLGLTRQFLVDYMRGSGFIKPVATGMWTILETLLFGILLLYGSMLPLSFKPTIENCIIMRWIRELGFIVCYGAIILKLYRILMEFRTRKAHRWIVKDKDLLKYLLGMVLVMLTYLTAWTATNLNFIKEGFTIVTFGVTTSGEYFQTCKPLWWDYVTQAGEMVILLFGLHLGLAARSAAGQFTELRYLIGAVLIEGVVSAAYYVTHALTWRYLHPNHAYLAAFLRCHFTATFVLGFIFTPLILYHGKPVRDSRHHLTHEPSDAYKPSDGGVYGEIDVTEVNLSEMNPEEIRAELKRLYTQLEVLRNKSICQNNPHISKRRGGRKVAHRRFSLQKKGSREKALQQKKKQLEKPQASEVEAGDQEASRTPEDSVCSMEGPSTVYNDGPSTYSELGGFGTPSSSRKNNERQ